MIMSPSGVKRAIMYGGPKHGEIFEVPVSMHRMLFPHLGPMNVFPYSYQLEDAKSGMPLVGISDKECLIKELTLHTYKNDPRYLKNEHLFTLVEGPDPAGYLTAFWFLIDWHGVIK